MFAGDSGIEELDLRGFDTASVVNMEGMFSGCSKIQSLDLGSHNNLRPTVVTRLGDIYAKGVISDARVKLDRGSAEISTELISVQKDKRAHQYPRSEVYKVSEARD